MRRKSLSAGTGKRTLSASPLTAAVALFGAVLCGALLVGRIAVAQPDAESAHGSDGSGAEATHSEGHAAGHHEAPGEINWFYGFLGTTSEEGEEPGLLFRSPDMPPPFAALLLNTAVVFFALYHFGKKPVAAALAKRKADLLRGIEEAAGMKEEAVAQLTTYEVKLDHLQDEIDRVRRESQEHGAKERERILREAQEKRERIEHEARTIVSLELKAHREALRTEVIQGAMKTARELLTTQLGILDHQRMVDEYLAALDRARLGGES